MYYQGKFKPKNKSKYKGDVNNIIYRSSWELQVLKWCDINDTVLSYSSEEVVVPYFFDVDKQVHRYFVDFKINLVDGRTLLIEVKPERETIPPQGQRRTKRLMEEALGYIKNVNKWQAAEEYAKDRGWEFHIWTEKHLTEMGILKRQTKTKKDHIKPLPKLKPMKVKKSKK